MADLKPCKYCGEKPKVFSLGVRIDNEYWIRCENKTCQEKPFTASYDTEHEAIEAWNHRVTEAEIKAKAEHTYENCHNITCRRKCQKDGYNLAIDEFAEKLKKEVRPMFDYYYDYRMWEKRIDSVAEQLKEEQ